jgi:hypothetical protein
LISSDCADASNVSPINFSAILTEISATLPLIPEMASFLDCSISSFARCLARRASSAASATILALLDSASFALLIILIASSRDPANSVSRCIANASAFSRAFSALSISSLIF